MTTRTLRDPSPVRSGFVHGSLGLLCLVGVFGVGGGILHLFGDADAAGPRIQVALFEPSDASPDLKSRLPSDDLSGLTLAANSSPEAIEASLREPDLGVEYNSGASPAPVRQVSSSQTEGIRINGKIVMPGQSLSQLTQPGDAAPSAAQLDVAAAEIAETQAQTPFEKNARPFDNPQGKPTVSVILSGLGINRRHTEAAINELPAEVTLSFAPTASNLKSYVRQARAAGHEVLVELPMEPYDYGRERPHPFILQVAAGADTNTSRLRRLLSQIDGFAGVTNYQGAKFATSDEAAKPVFAELSQRGLAFFEDGSLSRSVFEATASETNLTFARANSVLDARPDAEDIETKLMTLEADALENGSALGSGFAYPVTIDMLKDWTGRLEDKGILLAPASYHAKRSKPAGQVEIAALDQAG